MEQLGSHWMDFHEILYMGILKKCVKKTQVWLKSVKISGTLQDEVCIFIRISHRNVHRIRHISNVEKIKTPILCPIHFLHKLYHLRDNVENYGTARWAKDDNVVQHLHVACWTTEDTQTQNKVILLFHCNSGYSNQPRILFFLKWHLNQHTRIPCMPQKCNLAKKFSWLWQQEPWPKHNTIPPTCFFLVKRLEYTICWLEGSCFSTSPFPKTTVFWVVSIRMVA